MAFLDDYFNNKKTVKNKDTVVLCVHCMDKSNNNLSNVDVKVIDLTGKVLLSSITGMNGCVECDYNYISDKVVKINAVKVGYFPVTGVEMITDKGMLVTLKLDKLII